MIINFRWRGFAFGELANDCSSYPLARIFRWRGFVIRAIGSVAMRAISVVFSNGFLGGPLRFMNFTNITVRCTFEPKGLQLPNIYMIA
jgi:hypothetical protein